MPVTIQTTATSRPPTPVGALFSQPPVISTLEVHHKDSQTPCAYCLGKSPSFFLRSNHQSRCEETNRPSPSRPSKRAKSQVSRLESSTVFDGLPSAPPTMICRPDS